MAEGAPSRKVEGKLNPMTKVSLEKVVVHMGVGASGEKLAKAAKALESLTNQKPSYRKAKKTIKEFGIRKGEPITCMVTLRGRRAEEFLAKALSAIGNKIKASQLDPYGNISFGVKEHIMFPGVRYDPDIGIFGLDVCVKLKKPGFRVAERMRRRSKIGGKHTVTPEEASSFLNKKFNVKIE